MTTDARFLRPDPDCERFEALLGPWLERECNAADHAWMTRHRAHCAACAALVGDLESLVTQAAALPGITPPRDLWSGIEARLEAPVIPLPVRSVAVAPRTISVRRFAIAAAALVAVSSAVTWQLASRGASVAPVASTGTGTPAGPDAAPTVAVAPAADAAGDEPLAQPTAQLVVGSSAVTRPRTTRTVAAVDDELDAADATFEREITVLRRIVDERFTELDTATVRELRRNLEIIDRAIADSRDLLQRDPRSGLLAAQLDRALRAKLDLLRRVALL